MQVEYKDDFMAVGLSLAVTPVRVSLAVARDTPTRHFVYSMVVLPVIFVVLFLHAGWLDAAHSLQDFTVALAATVFTVLPIRQVLVVPELEGELTRTDLFLGVGIFLAVFVATVRYSSSVFKN